MRLSVRECVCVREREAERETERDFKSREKKKTPVVPDTGRASRCRPVGLEGPEKSLSNQYRKCPCEEAISERTCIRALQATQNTSRRRGVILFARLSSEKGFLH